MKPLTPRQRQVLEFIRSEVRWRGAPPTIREIGAHLHARSTGTVRDHLRALEQKGYILRRRHRSRGIELAVRPRQVIPPARRGIPILGRIAAGSPTFAEENLEGTIPIDPQALVRDGEVFALHVHGDSMQNAGILDHDFVFVRKQDTAENGDIVAVLIDEEATVKRFFREKRRIRLQPENPAMKPIYLKPNDVTPILLGKVVGVWRTY